MSEAGQHSGRLSRREFLKLAGAGAAYTTLGGLGALSLPRAVLAGQTTNLTFTVWSYSVDTIQDNIKRFQTLYPGIKVQVSDIPWPKYRDTMVTRLSGRSRIHVLYNGGDWLPEFARAGWVVPLEDYLPKARTYYAPKIVGYALQDMTYQGKMYGLPYYADITTFQYNGKILSDRGVKKAPETWEELEDQAKFLRGKGIASPIVFEFATDLPTSMDNFTAMVFGRGGDWFDADFNPVFDQPNSQVRQHLAWVSSVVKSKLATVLPHETDVVKAMNTGRHVYTVLWNYNLAEANNKAVSPRAGQFKIALMPGAAHGTQGQCKFYNLTKYAVDQGQETVDAALKFIEYFGGEHNGQYRIAKRWAVEKGLGFGQLPLYADRDVQRSFGQWIDFDMFRSQARRARARRHPVWEGTFNEFARVQLVRTISGQTGVDDSIGAMAQKAKELKAQFK
ncbi:MAG TPA: substrate-binding domain-containing protein [bacterium]|nr:substrate-binding domain-containing protein [bacterium]